MVKVGDVCPLFFSPIKNKFGLEMDYIQRFHTSDKIHIQVFASASEEVSVTLNNLVTETSTPVSLSTYNQNDNVLMHYAVLSGLDDAKYTVTVNEFGKVKPMPSLRIIRKCSVHILIRSLLLGI